MGSTAKMIIATFGMYWAIEIPVWIFEGMYSPVSLIKIPKIDLKTWLWIMLLVLTVGDVDTKVVNIGTPNLALIHISNNNPRIKVQKTRIMTSLR